MSSLGRILVTGADGFIGSHLVEALVDAGYSVRAFVQYNSFNSWGWLDEAQENVRKNLDVFAGDVRDAHGVRTAMKDCDTVMHLAALIAIPYSYHSPGAYVDTNVSGTLNIVQAAQDLRIARCIVTSTSEVYGTARFVPITEEHPLQGQSPYSASKIGADQIALSFHKSFGTPVAVIRPFNTYGPRQSARAIIPTVITQILAGKTVLKLGALTPTRDFNFVSDTVAGFITMAEAMAAQRDGVIGEVTNLGTGYEIAIGDTVNLIAELMGAKITIETEEARVRPATSEVERLCADNTRAKERLGWTPQYAGREGVRRGLQETIAWFSAPGRLARYKADLYNL